MFIKQHQVVVAILFATFAFVYTSTNVHADNKSLIQTYRFIEPDVPGKDTKIQVAVGKPTAVIWKQHGQAFYPMEFGTDRILIFYDTKNFDWPDIERLPENGGFHGLTRLPAGFQIPPGYEKGFHLVLSKDSAAGPRIVLRYPGYVNN